MGGWVRTIFWGGYSVDELLDGWVTIGLSAVLVLLLLCIPSDLALNLILIVDETLGGWVGTGVLILAVVVVVVPLLFKACDKPLNMTSIGMCIGVALSEGGNWTVIPEELMIGEGTRAAGVSSGAGILTGGGVTVLGGHTSWYSGGLSLLG